MFLRLSRTHLLITLLIGITFIAVSLNWTINEPSLQNKDQLVENRAQDASTTRQKIQRDHKVGDTTHPSDPVLLFEREKLTQRIRDLVTGELEVADREHHWELQRFNYDRGEAPQRVLLMAHWRSGSSFVADVLASHPGAFYVFEPLMKLTQNKGSENDHQIRGGAEATQANFVLKELFRCRFSSLDQDYFRWLTNDYFFFINHNAHLLECKAHERAVCTDVPFLSNTCRAFPLQVVKVVRYRLDYRLALLEDKTLENLRVIYLVRDPRAIMNSRIKLDWCAQNPECSDPKILCEDLVREFHLSTMLREKYPGRFKVLRYEEIAQNPFETTKEVFKFLHLMFTNKTERFLQLHTSVQVKDDPYSTFKNSKSALQRWLKEMNATYLKDIEDLCGEAMQLWNYVRVTEN